MILFFRSKPKIKKSIKHESFSGWLKCVSCGELIHEHELEQNLSCCPKCEYHHRLSVKKRIENLIDSESFTELFGNIITVDTLKFVDTMPYTERLKAAQEKSKSREAVTVGVGDLEGRKIALGVLDFEFMGGSMGSVVGEKITLIIEYALSHKLPLVIVSASGGARMQESTLSLMQMAKTSAALAKFSKASLPYISVLTNPTMGGTIASFASLGDIIIAEPEALIGFTGPRVIEQTIRHKLPPNFQKSEFLLEHGWIDSIVPRKKLKKYLSSLLYFLVK